MGFPADMSDHIDPSNLLSSYQPSDAEWLSKDPFDILPWDMSSIDQTFNPFAEGAGPIELEPRSSYATSNHGSPTEFGGYSIKTEDALSDASPLSVSPRHFSVPLSQFLVHLCEPTSNGSMANMYRYRMPRVRHGLHHIVMITRVGASPL